MIRLFFAISFWVWLVCVRFVLFWDRTLGLCCTVGGAVVVFLLFCNYVEFVVLCCVVFGLVEGAGEKVGYRIGFF